MCLLQFWISSHLADFVTGNSGWPGLKMCPSRQFSRLLLSGSPYVLQVQDSIYLIHWLAESISSNPKPEAVQAELLFNSHRSQAKWTNFLIVSGQI